MYRVERAGLLRLETSYRPFGGVFPVSHTLLSDYPVISMKSFKSSLHEDTFRTEEGSLESNPILFHKEGGHD